MRFGLNLRRMFAFINISFFVVALISLVYGFLLPDHTARDEAFCYAYDAIIVHFKCKNDVVSTIPNLTNPLLNWVWAMFNPYFWPLILAINYMSFLGFLKFWKAIGGKISERDVK